MITPRLNKTATTHRRILGSILSPPAWMETRYAEAMRAATAGCLLLIAFQPADAVSFHLRRNSPAHHNSTVSLRKRLHINDLITEPGTMEMDWGNLYSYTTATFTMPAAVKYTPAGNS